MPPEQLPWDRRDFRKHDRSGSDQRFSAGGFGGSEPHRWREQHNNPHAPPEQLPWDRRDFRKHDRSGSDQRFSAGGFGGGEPHRWKEQHNNPHAPPEQLPWDRRDFRKHDRSGSGGGFGGGGPHRWREQHQHPHAPLEDPPPYHQHQNRRQQQRRYSDFRSSRPIPLGHGKEGAWPMYPDEAGHEYPPFGSRYGDRNLEDDNFRPFGSRGDGRYFRSSRENKGSFSQKDWRSPSGEPVASSSGPGRPNTEANNQKSVENTQTGGYPDEAGHGYPAFGSRFDDRNLEDDNFRPFGSRGDGRYIRSSRENRGSFSQKDWRSPSGEPVASSSGPGRLNTEANNQKSVENTQTGGSPDEAGNVYPAFGSKYGDRNLEDDNFRPFGSRGDGRYFRSSRENRGSFSQKEWRSPSGEPVASSRGPGRPNTDVNNPKSVENTEAGHDNSSKGNNSENTQTCHNNSSKGNDSENTQTCHNDSIKGNNPPHPLPDSLSGQFLSVVKEKQENDGNIADESASSGQKSEKENVLGSMDWKLKWNRSGLSSRGSGFSRSSSSKSMGVDPIDIVTEVQQKNATPVNSPAAVCVEPAAPAPSDDTSSRKKPRLGWGEGLAKYEKKKVDGPEDGVTKDGMVSSVSTTETMQLSSVSLLDKSPKVVNLSDCASPATPSSVACSSSPGIEEKESIKAANIDQDTANLSCSPSIMSQTHCEGPTFNLENLDLSSIANLSSLINEMIQSDDPSSVETGYVRTTSMNKLLVWKVDMLKALEVTESEIDSLETELKSLIAEPRSCCPHPAASSLLPEECHSKPCEQVTACSTVRPAPLQVVASGDMIVENMPAVHEDRHGPLKDEDIDSPGSATSKLVEALPSGEGVFLSETPECVEGFVNLGSNNSSNSGSSENGSSDEDKTCLVDDRTPSVINCQNLDCGGNMHFNVDNIYESILASNKDSANRALEELNKLLPARQCLSDTLAASSVSSLQRDSSVIKERFLTRKRFLSLKEKVITLKFKVFQHFWREGRIVSISKLRGKYHKKLDLCRTGYKKNRSSSRSRISYSAGSPRKVPAEEVIEFVNWLLTESPFKPCRSTLKMPALILDKEIKMSRFISNNALVLDPCAAEKERSMINPWTAEEREIFIDKLAIFGKNFSKIASFLEHKTIADCIEFYYKNHKSESFGRARKEPGVTKQIKSQSTTYLVANGKRWNREANAASLDMLGEASLIAANANDGTETQRKCTSRIFLGASTSHKVPRGDNGQLERSNSLDMYSNETVAADVLAGICGSLSTEAMSSSITSSVDPADGYQDWKCQRVSSCVKRPLTPDVTQNVDDECSDESCGEMDPTDWSDEEKSIFVQAVSSYGKDFVMISQCLRTRSMEQCKIFYSKARKCLGLDQILPGACNAVSGDVNGGGSDTEDACVVQTGDVVCNADLECKMEEDRPPPDIKCSHESDIVGTINLKPDVKICGENSRPLDSMAAEPVSKNSSMGDTQVDEKPVMGFNVDSRELSGANGACTSEHDVRPSVVSTNVESVRVEGDDHGRSNGLSDSDNKALVEVSNGHHGEDNEGEGLILPEDNSDNKKVEDGGANNSEATVIRCTSSEMKAEPSGNVSHSCVDSRSSIQKESGCQKLPLQQNGHFASVESSTLFSVPIKYQRHSSTDAQSDAGANGISEKHSQKVVRTGDCQQHLSGYSLSDSVEPSQILRGYPVSVQTVKEINGDVNCVRHVPLQNVVPKRDGKLHSDRHTELSLRKCTTGSRHQSEVVSFSSQEHSRTQSGCSPDVDKPPSRNGDVKLFGKILISSQERTNSCAQGNGDENGQHHKAGRQSLNLQFSGDQKVNLDSFQSKVDCNKYLPSENIPFKSYSCWDENRTQAAIFPPLPDSTLLLAKYPAAFSNHSTPTVKLEQTPLNGVIRTNNDHPFNGVSVFPSREMSSTNNGIADYQLLINRELQPFTVDMKQSQEVLFSEMQRRNGFGVVQGMQQQTRAMVGIDVVGRGGVLVGAQCSGVSDPVTAIKMHYAKAQNISLQAGNIIREDDKWRSNGDAGR
ncbi:hypothetical protein DH2020_028296 [Rehmannia glutinosa]|uniref:SANT domain-containing protein n=1 Tax=Rehmannia glutinosa TaxID=99300 RepID=A0ABR0VVB9_REHGL